MRFMYLKCLQDQHYSCSSTKNCLRLNRKRTFLLIVLTRTERFSENIVGLYYSEDIVSACETQTVTSHVKLGKSRVQWSSAIELFKRVSLLFCIKRIRTTIHHILNATLLGITVADKRHSRSVQAILMHIYLYTNINLFNHLKWFIMTEILKQNLRYHS